MWVLICATLVVGALGHYHLYDPRSLQNDMEPRQEPAYSEYGAPREIFKVVECPVCGASNYELDVETCPLSGRKICRHGLYRNPGCGNPDCFRAEGEPCDENPNDGFIVRCAPGYRCQYNRCISPLTETIHADRIHEQMYRLKQSQFGSKIKE